MAFGGSSVGEGRRVEFETVSGQWVGFGVE